MLISSATQPTDIEITSPNDHPYRLSAGEVALVINALREKARADETAAHAVRGQFRVENALREQAVMADKLADEIEARS